MKKVAVIMGLASHPSAIGRTNGFQDYINDHPELGLECVEPQNADWDRNAAKDVADTLIRQYDDLVGIYCNNDTMAMGALESLRDADKIGEVVLAGTDASTEAIESILANELDITIGNFPYYYGRQGLHVILHMMNGENVPPRIQSIIATMTDKNATTDVVAQLELMGYGNLNYMSVEDYNAAHASK